MTAQLFRGRYIPLKHGDFAVYVFHESVQNRSYPMLRRHFVMLGYMVGAAIGKDTKALRFKPWTRESLR